jgi:hypothetical protein
MCSALRDRWLIFAAFAAWLVVAISMAALDLPLKHDEAQYAVAARGDASWLYLSVGTVELARLGLWLGDGPRLVAIAMNASIVLATWWLGRAAFDGRVGALAAAVIAGAHPFVLRAADLVADLPAASCAVFGIAVVVRELESERGPSWWLVAAAPAFAGAFYFRYGHAPLVAIVAAAALVVYPRRLAAWPVVATVAAFALLLVPHFATSLRDTGSPLGILELSAGVPARSYIGEGLVAYMSSNPLSEFGVLGAPLVLAGIVGALRPPARWRPPVFLAAIAVGQLVVLGLQARAQPRYIYVATILLVVVGVDAAARVVPAWLVRRIAVPLVALALFAVAAAAVPVGRHRARARQPIAVAADAIRADAAGRPCAIASLQVPQLVWRTGCAGILPRAPWPEGRLRYLVSVPDGRVELDDTAATPLPVADPRARVWLLAR